MNYCTYLIVYSGNKVPPFYIGSSSIDKVKNGYMGSVTSKKYKQIWKSELKLNRHLFKIFIISTHSTRKEASDKESLLQKKLNIIQNPLYVNQAIIYNNKEFYSPLKGKKSPHYGKIRTDEVKLKISNSRIGEYSGKNHPRFGKKHTKQSKIKMSLTRKANFKISEEERKRRSVYLSKNNPKKGKNKGADNPNYGKSKYKIIQLDQDMNIIKIWNIAREIELSIGIRQEYIRRVCNEYKQNKSNGYFKGYYWRYIN